MTEEVSPESKVYVKEEIDKMRKEFKEDLNDARSRATKTFTIVALIVGLLTTLGVYGNISSLLRSKVQQETLKRIKEQLSAREQQDMELIAKQKNGYAYVGGFKFVWGARESSKKAVRNYDDQRFLFAPDDANNTTEYNLKKCFVVITDIEGEVYNTDYFGFNLRRNALYQKRYDSPDYQNSGRKPLITKDGKGELSVPFTFLAIGT
ncbi:MAG: hypothetical protein GY774_36150 [Planctomycetes bacterium]|nr:hypothetical protein [Planctomycetota bacterium]